MQRLMVLMVLVAALLAMPVMAGDSFSHRGYNSARNGLVASFAPRPSLSAPRFVASISGFTMTGQCTPVVSGQRLFVTGADDLGASQLMAFSEVDGALLWVVPIAQAEWDSHSSPTVDVARNAVLIGSGNVVTCVTADTGELLWERPLANPIVNSTVCVVGDLGLICDYSPMAVGSTLYAINLNPQHPTLAAGAIAWSRAISKSIGSEAAIHAASSVIVTDYDGYVRQFTLANAPGWNFAVPGAGTFSKTYGSFAGGPAVDGDRVYAATYNFYGDEDNSRLYCLNALTGQKIWEAASERSDATPVVTADKVILSGGLIGYGSQPKVEAFNKSTGAKLWEWTAAGGWMTQPIVVGNVLYIGTTDEWDDFAPCTDLYALDLAKTPSQGGFVLGHFSGAGSSPSYADKNIYTIGAGGLYAFGPTPALEGQVMNWWAMNSYGPAGEYAIEMTSGYVEPGVKGLGKLMVIFDLALDPQTVAGQVLAITGQRSGAISLSGAAWTLDSSGTVLTVTLPQKLPDADRYQLSVGAALRTTDGAPITGNTMLSAGTLAGDADGSGTVDAGDVVAVRPFVAKVLTWENACFDVDGSGTFTNNDLLQVRKRLGNQLP